MPLAPSLGSGLMSGVLLGLNSKQRDKVIGLAPKIRVALQN